MLRPLFLLFNLLLESPPVCEETKSGLCVQSKRVRQGIDLHGCNMAGINLSDTDLSGANFSNADMHNSKLVSSTLIGVNFSNTSLVNSDLKVTDMHNITILNANLAGADLAGVIGIDTQQLLHAYSLAGTRLPDGSVQPGNQPDKD